MASSRGISTDQLSVSEQTTGNTKVGLNPRFVGNPEVMRPAKLAGIVSVGETSPLHQQSGQDALAGGRPSQGF
jgi:hypothetical protein